MLLQRPLAVGLGRLTSWGLRTVVRRPASQLPGRVALTVDENVISELANKLTCGAIVVCGTNGKTTTTNIVAAAAESCGAKVLCNREGANMAAGVATALLPGSSADWAVLEADELSCRQVLPALRPRYLVLLNLFRDQLDRSGEIDHVQETIAEALKSSDGTTLVVCADDPLSWGVARRSGRDKDPAHLITFGIAEDLCLAPDRVSEARFCQDCGAELSYGYRAYAQLGAFRCPACDFRRPSLDYAATNVAVTDTGVAFDVTGKALAGPAHVESGFGGVYMVYNLLAAFVASTLAGATTRAFQRTLDTYQPANGRLQHFTIGGREVVLNLAKNPVGMNQNISMLLHDERKKHVLFIINDAPNDGRDISWIWDVDFERLAKEAQGDNLDVATSGTRANDVQVRLKYAGVAPFAPIVADVDEALERLGEAADDLPLYVLCNYSALRPAKDALDRLEEGGR